MTIRKARRGDVIDIVRMLGDDELGKQREDYREPLPEKYYLAFENIDKDFNQNLIVLETESSEIVGTLQLSFLQHLTYQGGLRAQIEAIRIRADYRGKALGEKMVRWAILEAKNRKAHLVQLTTDKKRHDALRFYKKLGFVASHEGMKLHLD